MGESFGIFIILLILWLVNCQRLALKERKDNEKRFNK